MGIEIERKYLLKDDSWRALAKGTQYRQGYLNSEKERVVRVRTINGKGFLTILFDSCRVGRFLVYRILQAVIYPASPRLFRILFIDD